MRPSILLAFLAGAGLVIGLTMIEAKQRAAAHLTAVQVQSFIKTDKVHP